MVFSCRSLVLAWMVLLCLPGGAQEWWYPLTLEFQQTRVEILNWELTRDKKWLLVHAKLTSLSSAPLRFPWRDLITLEGADGSSYSPNYDALVDRNGGGLTRTVGDFQIDPRDRVRISVPFIVSPEELPARLKLPDGRLSPEIR